MPVEVSAADDLPKTAFPITVDCSASQEGLARALRATQPGGWCTSVGIIYEVEVPLPLLEMYGNGVNFHIGRAMSRASLPAVLDLVAAGTIAPERVTSRVTTWDRAPEAVLEPETKLIITR